MNHLSPTSTLTMTPFSQNCDQARCKPRTVEALLVPEVEIVVLLIARIVRAVAGEVTAQSAASETRKLHRQNTAPIVPCKRIAI
jgi:hypothetical protein